MSPQRLELFRAMLSVNDVQSFHRNGFLIVNNSQFLQFSKKQSLGVLESDWGVFSLSVVTQDALTAMRDESDELFNSSEEDVVGTLGCILGMSSSYLSLLKGFWSQYKRSWLLVQNRTIKTTLFPPTARQKNTQPHEAQHHRSLKLSLTLSWDPLLA